MGGMGEPFRRAADDSASRAPFIKGLLVGVLAVALVWAILYTVRPPESQPAQPAASSDRVDSPVVAGTEAAASAGAGPTAPGPTAEAQCREVVAAQAPARRAAAAALAQWRVHVGAMNQLVAGEISLSQASAFWASTRVGAKRLLARYDAAVATLANSDVSCPAEPSDAGGLPSPCRMAVTADRRELRAADTAIETWRHHVVDMEMLRMGHMSPAQATRMWLRNWRQGVDELASYRDARQRARAQQC